MSVKQKKIPSYLKKFEEKIIDNHHIKFIKEKVFVFLNKLNFLYVFFMFFFRIRNIAINTFPQFQVF